MIIISKNIDGWTFQHASSHDLVRITNEEVKEYLDDISALKVVGDAALVAIAKAIGWDKRDAVLLANSTRVIDLTTRLQAVSVAIKD